MHLKHFLYILIISYGSLLLGQQNIPILKAEDYVLHKDSLLNEFGKNKVLLDKIALPSLVALSYYPELKETKIIFKRKKLNSTMAARPTFSSVFKRKGKRTYLIILNDYDDVKISLDSADFNCKVGVIGHELAHIAYYENKSSNHLKSLTYKYKNKKFREKFEKDTDERAINHGLGWQVYAFKKFVEEYKYTTEEYKKYKARFYLSSSDIKRLTIEYENK